MANPNLNLKKGECVGVVYKQAGVWKVHDGVLTAPIADGNKPPNTVTIIHFVVNQKTGKLVRQTRKLQNVNQVLRTINNPTFALKCPSTTNPNLRVGDCVVVKINKVNTPSGLDAKNGLLVCSLQNRLAPKGRVWINHWKIITKTRPRVFLETKQYPNALFVRKVMV
ncbi:MULTISPECIES: hypothetical protein [unclassified Brevibacillus]|uniref:hypothetical protein n=1 Tax=Brevibacillus TaxID=55080 RepID=UPI000EE0959E|nr:MULTISPECIES: hypothetical protein [unclassified Brevibacillus]UED71582.1 hypothetical protein HP435_13440 [Brevibacillus sp. HD3.3A]HBZ79362.1 hypothetical protein [Brevibacillus sp.]